MSNRINKSGGMDLIKAHRTRLKTKRVFLKQGTCSRTFFYILNREFGHNLPSEEQAIDPLAGGIFQQGYQCGMLWGSTMAIGAEAFRRTQDLNLAIPRAINATRHIMSSFVCQTNTIECHEITQCDFNRKWSLVKYLLSGRFYGCFRLAGRWAPKAIEAAHQGLSIPSHRNILQNPASCASELVKRMGGTEMEMAMVAGFAGGLGLSGNGCGALAAAIWMNTLSKVRRNEYKYSLSDPDMAAILKTFLESTDYEFECKVITSRSFDTEQEHADFLCAGGCNDLITNLSKHVFQD